jgi:hypothetical protein
MVKIVYSKMKRVQIVIHRHQFTPSAVQYCIKQNVLTANVLLRVKIINRIAHHESYFSRSELTSLVNFTGVIGAEPSPELEESKVGADLEGHIEAS